MDSKDFDNGLVLAGGRVVDPANGVDCIKDIGLLGRRVVPAASLPGAMRLDMSGKVLAPGFIDVHVHLREPGQTWKEDIGTGTGAAEAGGFATVVAMPNTVPAMDTPDRIREFMALAARKAKVHVLAAGAMTLGRLGAEPTDAAGLAEAGCPFLSDDGGTPQSAGVMRSVMMAAADAGLPVVDHCEDLSLSRPGVMHAGDVARELGLPGQPRSAEELVVARDVLLALETGCHVHLQHLSSALSVEMVRTAKRMGARVTAEATPHHLFLTDEACREHGTNAKMAPPLREEADRRALVDGLVDGTLDMIATDHAPHSMEEKARGWAEAPFGIVGLETAVPLCLERLYHGGILALPRLVALFTSGPASLLSSYCGRTGLLLGSLAEGSAGGVTVLDLDARSRIDVSKFKSRGRNCPYDGIQCRGRVAGVFI